ncbi:MAG: YncE family protein, partial [Ardenticatenaceae bacterium]
IELATGAERGKAIVQGHYELPATRLGTQHGGLSPNGQWLALQKVVGSQSRFAVFETSLDGPPRVATLPGRFHFDALSNDGRSLYLTEHLAEEEPLRYQVRRYDLFLDALDPRVIADKSGSGPMLGRYLSSLPSRTGEWLYSLYLNETKGPFIHALNLNNRWAICIFLPDQGKEQLELQLRWTMTLSEDGKSLYAANGALGRVVEVDTTDHRVRRMAAFDLAQPETAGDLRERLLPWFASAASAKRAMLGSATLANAGDTLFVSGERGLLVIDTEELELREHLLLDWTFDSGVLSPDGTRLYLSSGERRSILALDARSYALLDEIEVGGNLVGILYVADR